jgi:cell division protein FtsB
MNGTMTYSELAKKEGVTIRAIQTRFLKAGGAQFDRHANIPHEMMSAMTATRKSNTRKSRAKRAVVSPIIRQENQGETLRAEIAALRNEISALKTAKQEAEKQANELFGISEQLREKLQRRAGSFQWLLDGINVLEIGLVIVGSVLLLSWAGLLVAAITTAFYGHTVIKLRNQDVSSDAKNLGLTVCCIMACGFSWLHGQSFWQLLRSDMAGGFRYTVACCLAVTMTLIPIFSLFQTRNINE